MLVTILIHQNLTLFRACWVERINSLKVTLDLMKAVIEALMEMHENTDNSWNRDTTTKAYSLIKALTFSSLLL